VSAEWCAALLRGEACGATRDAQGIWRTADGVEVRVIVEPPPVRFVVPQSPDAYDAPQPCAPPTAATVTVTDGPITETPHVQRARQRRQR